MDYFGNLAISGVICREPQSVNNAGDVVGWSYNTAGRSHGFIYSGGALMDLNDLIDSSSGLIITRAAGISNGGQIAAVAQDSLTEDACDNKATAISRSHLQ